MRNVEQIEAAATDAVRHFLIHEINKLEGEGTRQLQETMSYLRPAISRMAKGYSACIHR